MDQPRHVYQYQVNIDQARPQAEGEVMNKLNLVGLLNSRDGKTLTLRGNDPLLPEAILKALEEAGYRAIGIVSETEEVSFDEKLKQALGTITKGQVSTSEVGQISINDHDSAGGIQVLTQPFRNITFGVQKVDAETYSIRITCFWGYGSPLSTDEFSVTLNTGNLLRKVIPLSHPDTHELVYRDVLELLMGRFKKQDVSS